MLTSALLLAPLMAHSQDAHEALPPTGRVFAYGEELLPPFVFEGMDSDTLLLNGVPFSPRRVEQLPSAPVLSPEESVQLDENEAVISTLEEKANLIMRDAPSREAGHRDVLELYRASPYVESVRIEGTWVQAKFTFYSFEVGKPLRFGAVQTARASSRAQELERRRAERRERVKQFWNFLGHGYLVVLGEDYEFFMPPQAAEDILHRVRVAAAQKRVESSGTFDYVGRFLEEVARSGAK
ncbi:MAG: hypothetical protein ACT4PE_16490 [Candidatus Eiseniibacteriota bacterium]